MKFLIKAFAFLELTSLASAEYNIHQNCNAAQRLRIKNGLEDARLLAGRAASTLQQAFTEPGGIPVPVQRILDAFLGVGAAGAYHAVWGVYNEIANDLQNKNILYSCADLNFIFQHTGRLNHPLELKRIDGQVSNQNDCPWYFFNEQWFIFPINPTNPLDQAVTVTFTPTMGINYQKQIQCTGSHAEWSDITMVQALQGNNPVTFAQWPSFLGKQSWKDLVDYEDDDDDDPLSFQRNDILSETLLHELMHSIAVPDPTGFHTQGGLSGGSVNKLGDALDAANGGGAAGLPLSQNPGTLSWLCISLAMPWYKLFDQTTQSWDGVVRYNSYGPNNAYVWIPNWVTGGGAPTVDQFNRALALGPYA